MIRVWWIPQVPMPAFRYSVPDLATGILLCDALAQYDLFQYENHIKPDYSNTGGIEVYNDGEWESIDPDDPFDIEYAESILQGIKA